MSCLEAFSNTSTSERTKRVNDGRASPQDPLAAPQTSAPAESASKQLDQNSAPQVAPGSQAADFAGPQPSTGAQHGQQDPDQPDCAQPGSVGNDAFMQSLALEQLEYDSDLAFQMPGCCGNSGVRRHDPGVWADARVI